MKHLRRKSFYIYDHQYRQLIDHVYRIYSETGVRVTEREVVREALDLYFRTRTKASPAPRSDHEP